MVISLEMHAGTAAFIEAAARSSIAREEGDSDGDNSHTTRWIGARSSVDARVKFQRSGQANLAE